MLDIRKPIALLFLILGVVLAGYGAFTPAEMYKPSLGYNINLIWGGAMIAFALLMGAWMAMSPQSEG